MPDYRFKTLARQTDVMEFGIAFAEVCAHLRALGITATNLRVKTARLTFFASAAIPANQLAHLDLEAG